MAWLPSPRVRVSYPGVLARGTTPGTTGITGSAGHDFGAPASPEMERVRVRREMFVSIPGSDEQEMRVPTSDERAISLDEASRQLELAVHDAQVSFDCIALGNLDRAHTNAVTARTAADAAETLLRAVLGRTAEPHEGPVTEPD